MASFWEKHSGEIQQHSKKHEKMQNAILNNKKGFSGSGTVLIILFIFVGIGLVLPFVNTAFNIEDSNIDTDNPANELIDEDFTDVSGIGAGDIIKSIGKMFFWTFGDLPFWMDAIFVVLRIIMLMILIKAFTPFL